MVKQRNLALDKMFPISGKTAATDAALANAFPEAEEEQTLREALQDIDRTYRNIPIEKLVPNPYQPRKQFDQQKLRELADSLLEDGMLEPILVRISPTQEGLYEIAAGERRWRAAKIAGLATCPAEILTVCPNARMQRIALLENLMREQLSPLELAQTYDALLQERDGQDRPVYTVRSLAAMLHKDKGHVDDHRALLRVPLDVRNLIEEDPTIPVRVIRELGSVEDMTDRSYLISEVRTRNLKTADVLSILHHRKKHKRKIIQHEDGARENGVANGNRPDQSVERPSTALAIAVLERKLKRDQAQFQKVTERLASELAEMGTEEKHLVRDYLNRWQETLQRITASL